MKAPTSTLAVVETKQKFCSFKHQTIEPMLVILVRAYMVIGWSMITLSHAYGDQIVLGVCKNFLNDNILLLFKVATFWDQMFLFLFNHRWILYAAGKTQ